MLHICPESHDVMTSYYHNLRVMCTTIQLCCTLGTSFGIVFSALFDCGCNPDLSSRKYMFWESEQLYMDFDNICYPGACVGSRLRNITHVASANNVTIKNACIQKALTSTEEH